MKKQILGLIVGIFLLSLTSAIYPGECETIKFANQEPVNFTLISNTSSFEGFTWDKIDYDITYCLSTDFIPGNYTFEWSNYQDELTEPTEVIVEVHHYSSGGGGSSSTKYVDKVIEVPTKCDNEPRVITAMNNETIGQDQEIKQDGFFKRFWNWFKNLFRSKK